MSTKYRVHRFNLAMTNDQGKLEQFLNSLEGEIVSIVQMSRGFQKYRWILCSL